MKAVMLLLVLAGVVWASTNDEGRIFLVRAAATLKMVPPVLELDVRDIGKGLAQTDLQGSFNGVRFKCAPDSGGLGDTACYSDVSLLNGMPAYGVAFFFSNGRANAVRIALQQKSQEKLDYYLQTQFSQGEWRTEPSRTPGAEPLKILRLSDGVLMTSREPSRLDEIVLLWMPH